MKFIASLALATSLAAPAFAGGMAEPVPEPYIAPVVIAPVTADWSGFYAGAQLGYGDVSGKNAPVTPVTGVLGALDGNGAIGGLHAGYRYDFGQFVTGIELAYNASNIELSPTVDLDSLTQLKLTGGFDMGRTLVYGTVGAAHAKTSIGSDNGWLVGLGMDYALNDAWTLGAEVTHNRFDDFKSSGQDLRANLLQLRVGYRF